MSHIFILARLCAPFDEVAEDIEKFAKHFAIDPWAGFFVDDVALIPVDGISLSPEAFRQKWDIQLRSGPFEDFAIGRICGLGHAAIDTHYVDRFAGQTFTFGRSSRVIRVGFDPSLGWVEADIDVEDDFDDKKFVGDDAGESGDEVLVEAEAEEVDGDFESEGISDWFNSQPSLRMSSGGDAKLLIVNSREEYQSFERTKSGEQLLRELGAAASIIMKGTRVAVIATRDKNSPWLMYERLRRFLHPRLIEDFVIIDIGSEIAALHPNLSVLGNWVERSLIGNEVPDFETVFSSRGKSHRA